ncbi:hypothetical protein [Nocardia carnea]|nr:hypothetical protein [Nocardia carnea]
MPLSKPDGPIDIPSWPGSRFVGPPPRAGAAGGVASLRILVDNGYSILAF